MKDKRRYNNHEGNFIINQPLNRRYFMDIIKKNFQIFHILFKKHFLLVIITIYLFIIIAYLSWNNSLNERFSDEINHFIAGTLWLSGYIPYQDIQLNHQPLNYILPAIVSEVYKTDIIFRYVTIMRIAVAFYSIFWILLLVTKKNGLGFYLQ